MMPSPSQDISELIKKFLTLPVRDRRKIEHELSVEDRLNLKTYIAPTIKKPENVPAAPIPLQTSTFDAASLEGYSPWLATEIAKHWSPKDSTLTKPAQQILQKLVIENVGKS